MACNQELRRTVHGVVRKITVAKEQDIYFLNTTDWCQLLVVHVSDEHCEWGFAWPDNGKLEGLARIDIQQQDRHSTVFIVRSRQSSTPISPTRSQLCQQQVTDTISIPSSPPCQQQFAPTTLASPPTNPVSPLRQQSMPALAKCLLLPALCPFLIFFSPLVIVAVLILLCIIFWVGVVILLDLFLGPEHKTFVQAHDTTTPSPAPSANNLAPQDVGSSDGDILPANLTSAAHKLAIHLSRRNCSTAKYVKALPNHAIELVTAIWPHVRSLDIHDDMHTGLDDASIAGLLKGPIWQLDHVALTDNALGLRSISALVQTPQLQSVMLSNCNLDDQAVQKLVSASWPNLTQLDLAQNAIGTKGVMYLVQGKWQKLSALTLHGIDMNRSAVAVLMNANWPRLSFLALDITLACSEIFDLLSLDFDRADTSTSYSLLVPRNLKYRFYDYFPEQPPDMQTWPELDSVMFAS